jgi:hypothetical protein
MRVYEFLPAKGRNNYSPLIITLLLHWSSDEEQAFSVCLSVFLPLQPTVVVFSQPRSGL